MRFHYVVFIKDVLEAGIILSMGSANGRRRYYVTPPLIGWAHIQIDPCETLRTIASMLHWDLPVILLLCNGGESITWPVRLRW